MGNAYGIFRQKTQKEKIRNHVKDLVSHERMILKRILDRAGGY
jgi:hypothetical protein